MFFKVGHGFDAHRFSKNRDLILGGEKIAFNKGLLGHSDADVLIHAIIDALLGALALGDIGKHFPNDDPKYKNISSIKLLKKVLSHENLKQWTLCNLDCTVIAQQPKLEPYIYNMRKNIASVFNVDISQISIKATTTEKMGFCGREEGIAAFAVICIMPESYKVNI